MTLTLDLLGADHPGIVAEISASLAALDINIEDLATNVRDAPMSGGSLFEAHAVLSAPSSVSTHELRSLLEGLADELMVEINLSEDSRRHDRVGARVVTPRGAGQSRRARRPGLLAASSPRESCQAAWVNSRR